MSKIYESNIQIKGKYFMSLKVKELLSKKLFVMFMTSMIFASRLISL